MKEIASDLYRYPKRVMELYIETLTGAAFELRVSPFETIASVKSKIQRLEGIPIQQQHLIWNSVELDDDYCLHDYRIHDGATLKLVLAMRGGPINTRRSEYSAEEDLPEFPPMFVLEVCRKYITCTLYSGYTLGPALCTPVGSVACLSISISPITPQYMADSTGYSLQEVHSLHFPVPMEDPTIREMAEYMEANREEILDKLPSTSKQVTLLVFREGDQLNFFRVVDKKDGSLSPLSESFSGASMYNLGYDEEEEEDAPSKEKVEENEKTKDKMLSLRHKMEDLTLNKKPKKKAIVPRPPSTGRPTSKTRIRLISGATSKPSSPTFTTLNKNACLPPVGCTDGVAMGATSGQAFASSGGGGGSSQTTYSTATLTRDSIALLDEAGGEDTITETVLAALPAPSEVTTISSISPKKRLELQESAKSKRSLESVIEDQAPTAKTPTASNSQTKNTTSATRSPSEKEELQNLLQKAQASETRMEESAQQQRQHSSSKRKEITLETLRETLSLQTSASSSKSTEHQGLAEGPGRPLPLPPNSRKDMTLESLKDSFGRPPVSSSSTKYPTPKQGLVLESLSQSEARAMSGLLRQASLERLGSSKLSDFVRSASKSRAGFSLSGVNDLGRIPTPEGRIMSSRLQRLSASRDGRVMSPAHRLPPVKQKKKATKRCFVCAKKTGLATSYQCRCGNNFCATHRYAESHNCTFDYKTEGRKLLEQSNPVVSAPKLPKI